MIDVDGLSEELMDDLTRDEELRLVVYDDATGLPLHPGTLCHGHPTIGIGRALDVRGLSRAEVRLLAKNDTTEVLQQLDRTLPWFAPLDRVRQCALGNMAFNLGFHGLLAFHETLTLIEQKRYADAADAMLESKWASEVGARAQRLAEQIRTGLVVVPHPAH